MVTLRQKQQLQARPRELERPEPIYREKEGLIADFC
jgi:hypothetical protein